MYSFFSFSYIDSISKKPFNKSSQSTIPFAFHDKSSNSLYLLILIKSKNNTVKYFIISEMILKTIS